MKGQRLGSIFRHPEDWQELFPQFAVLVSDPPQLRLGLYDSLVPHLDRLYYAREILLGSRLVLNAGLGGFSMVSESASGVVQWLAYIVVCSGLNPWVCLVWF